MSTFNLLQFVIPVSLIIVQVFSTIDVNIGELQYLATHLHSYECRRLIATLHYTSHDLPKDISGAIRKVNEDIPCFQHLLHWNISPTEGRGKTHADLVLRLRQLKRKDLADWLSKTVFQKLGEDVLRSIDKPFGELGQEDIETQYSIMDEVSEELEVDVWSTVDTFLMIVLAVLCACVVVLMMILIIHHCKWYFYAKRKRSKAAKICNRDTCTRRKIVSKDENEEEEDEDGDEIEDVDEEKFLLYSTADATTTVNTSETDNQITD